MSEDVGLTRGIKVTKWLYDTINVAFERKQSDHDDGMGSIYVEVADVSGIILPVLSFADGPRRAASLAFRDFCKC